MFVSLGESGRDLGFLFGYVLRLGSVSRYCSFFRSLYAIRRLGSLDREVIITGVLSRGSICASVISTANTSATAVDEMGEDLRFKYSKCSGVFRHVGNRDGSRGMWSFYERL